MDRHAAWAVTAAIPLLAVMFYGATRLLPSFWGYFAALAVYWGCILIPLIAWRGGFRRKRLQLKWPARWLVIVNVLVILAAAVAAILALLENALPLWIIAVMATCAVLNGTLEELFWRGTVLQDGATRSDQAIQLFLFTGWHIALLFAADVAITGGATALLGGALLGGILWTASKVQTGTVGFGVLAHIGLNLFAFTELAANNVI